MTAQTLKQQRMLAAALTERARNSRIAAHEDVQAMHEPARQCRDIERDWSQRDIVDTRAAAAASRRARIRETIAAIVGIAIVTGCTAWLAGCL